MTIKMPMKMKIAYKHTEGYRLTLRAEKHNRHAAMSRCAKGREAYSKILCINLDIRTECMHEAYTTKSTVTGIKKVDNKELR
jgi:hypothetical protein